MWHVESYTTWSHADHFSDPGTESDYATEITQPEWLTTARSRQDGREPGRETKTASAAFKIVR